jgi:hypothetical protein
VPLNIHHGHSVVGQDSPNRGVRLKVLELHAVSPLPVRTTVAR